MPEDSMADETPAEHTERLSRAKAMEVWRSVPDALVLAGDTVVVLDGQLLGKPRGPAEAVEMLSVLSGRTHRVVSGLALVGPQGVLRSGSATTDVTFRALPGEPLDKAGAYGIQGLGSVLVREIQGDYHAVVGLPLPLLLDLLEEEGWRYDFGALVPLSIGPLHGH
jgi:septum formation protein